MPSRSRRTTSRSVLAVVPLALISLSACSSADTAHPRTSTRASTTAPAPSTSTLSGRIGSTNVTSLRMLHLQRGDRVRAVLLPASPLRAALGILAQPLTDEDVAAFTEAVDHGVHGRGSDLTHIDDNVPDRADVYDDSVTATYPSGYTLLVSSPVFRGDCDGGQNQWLAFLAPATGTYYLAALPTANDDQDAGDFRVRYEVQTGHPVDTSGSFDGTAPLSDWYARQYEAASGYFSDPSFFGGTRFAYGSAPYDNEDGCTNDGDWTPVP